MSEASKHQSAFGPIDLTFDATHNNVQRYENGLPHTALPDRVYSGSGEPPSDAFKPTDKVSRYGQVFTPPDLAIRMSRDLLRSDTRKPGLILDPCVGPGTFVNAMFQTNGLQPDDKITCIDIDKGMIDKCQASLGSCPNVKFYLGDYLYKNFDHKFDFAILNPPYIRQERIENKHGYMQFFLNEIGISVPGTSNLYIYFMIKTIFDLKIYGRYSMLVYNSVRYTKYGQLALSIIKNSSDDFSIEPVGQTPFDGRLIDAVIITGKKNRELSNQQLYRASVKENLGGSTRAPIGTIFDTKRGLRLKQAHFFMTEPDATSRLEATPFVKKIGGIKGFCVGRAQANAALLVNNIYERPKAVEELQRRLKAAQEEPHRWPAVLNWYRHRPEDWFIHQPPPKALIIFNYYVRNTPRHILNKVGPYSDNFYGLTWSFDASAYAVLALMNSKIVKEAIMGRGRSQGNGLIKLQLFEYREVLIPNITLLSSDDIARLDAAGRDLVNNGEHALAHIEDVMSGVLSSLKKLEAIGV